MKSEVYKLMVDTPDELFAPILNAAARKKKGEDQLRWTTRDLRTRVTRCIEVDGGIFESLLWTVRNSLFLCNKICHLNNKLKLKLINQAVISINFLPFTMLWCRFIQTALSLYIYISISLSISLSRSVTTQNFTHNHKNIFYNDQYYHLKKHWHFFLNHPV
jgi:hypothetical protein